MILKLVVKLKIQNIRQYIRVFVGDAVVYRVQDAQSRRCMWAQMAHTHHE